MPPRFFEDMCWHDSRIFITVDFGERKEGLHLRKLSSGTEHMTIPEVFWYKTSASSKCTELNVLPSRKHLLTQMSQPVSPGISLVYATDIAFWRQSQCMGKQSCWQKPARRSTCKRLQAALTCLVHTHSCYTFKIGSAKLELFAKVSVLLNSLMLKYFRYQALSNILKPSKTHSMQLIS